MGEMAELCYEEGLEQAFKDHGVDGYDMYAHIQPVCQTPSSSLDAGTCLHGYIKNYCVMDSCEHRQLTRYKR